MPWWSRHRCVNLAFCSANSPATSSPPTAASGARPRRRSSWSRAGSRSACLAIVPPCCAACRCATTAQAVLLVDEASRVRDELWATISPMLAAAPAAQQILLSTPAGASGEFHRAWSSDEDWEHVQITADQCPRISAEHLAAEIIRRATAVGHRS